MSDHEPKLAEGLLEYLQAMGGGWSAKLTMERLGFVKIIAKLATERDEALANNLKGMEVLATLSSGIKCLNGERDELLLHTIEVEAQRDEAMDQVKETNDE